MNKPLFLPIVAMLAAIAITTTMDATGLSPFSALPLLALLILFAFLQRLSPRRMGFTFASKRGWLLAAGYPLVVLGAVTFVAAAAGAIDASQTDWRRVGIDLSVVAASTFLVVILTEEGFFRGWLWTALGNAGLRPPVVLLLSSVAFALWHLSAVALPTGFDIPAPQIPLYIVNAAVMGTIWGMLRLLSGSVLVASLSHGLWNAGAYVLFGFGTRTGALGIGATSIFGPEVGVVGLFANAAFAALLWRHVRSLHAAQA